MMHLDMTVVTGVFKFVSLPALNIGTFYYTKMHLSKNDSLSNLTF